MPFENERALSFCAYLKRHYKIADENVYNVGDEFDALHGGLYPKDPDGNHTARSEIKAVQTKLLDWQSIFPHMKLCTSNHGMRWLKKASAAEIPSQLLRSYQDIFHTPEGWRWQDEWTIKEKHPFRIIHGLGYSGINGHRNAAMDSGGISTVIGHLHSSAGIAYIRTGGVSLRATQRIWGMNVGCLIDLESYAFKYGKDHRFKPCLGAGLVFNKGSTPVWIPLE